MSTRTPIYELYQWEGSDPVSRLEINENFLRLEQALAAKNTYQLIKEVTLTSASQTVSLNMSDIDWSKWHEVVIECTGSSLLRLLVNVNGEVTTETLGYASASYLGGGLNPSYVHALGVADLKNGRISLYPGQNPSGWLCARTVGASCNTVGSSASYTWSQVQTLDLCCDEAGVNIPSGSRFRVWGIQ